MKKLLVSLFLLAGGALSTFAQGFEPQVKVGYSYGVDNYKNQTFGGEFLAGFRINPTIRLGVGVGISYCDLKYEDAYYDSNTHSYYDEYKESGAYVPLFVNGKINFTDSSISPYFSTDLGYSFFIPCSDYAEENKLGLFVKPAFGVDFNLGKGDFFVEVNYNYQTRKFYENCNYSQIGISVGYQF